MQISDADADSDSDADSDAGAYAGADELSMKGEQPKQNLKAGCRKALQRRQTDSC